jgi:hypothetical protein
VQGHGERIKQRQNNKIPLIASVAPPPVDKGCLPLVARARGRARERDSQQGEREGFEALFPRGQVRNDDVDSSHERHLWSPDRLPRHLHLVQVFFTPKGSLRPSCKYSCDLQTWHNPLVMSERRMAAPASSAKEGEEEKKRRRIMMRTSISKDKLEKYRRHHQGVWPEVERGLRTHGVTLLTVKCPQCPVQPLQVAPFSARPCQKCFSSWPFSSSSSSPSRTRAQTHDFPRKSARDIIPTTCACKPRSMFPLPKEEEEAAARAHTSVSTRSQILMVPPPAHCRSTNQQTAEIS